MNGDDRVASSADPSRDGGDEQKHGGLHRLMKALFELTPWSLRRRTERQGEALGRAEARLDALEDGLRQAQSELAEVRDQRLAPAESRLDAAEGSLTSVTREATRLRDEVIPAMVGRADVLLERLFSEIEELGSLVERMLRKEPLPVPGKSNLDEAKLSLALADVQPALLEVFRGPSAEIRHRLDHYLEALRKAPPVLDLGCGRGELLLLLREAGVEAAGIEGDAAVADAARRRGLDVLEGDVLSVLETLPDASRSAVTAIHLFEHLEAVILIAVLAEVRRVLRPGGLLIVESPNPHSLRVGASLYWVDPTHRRPLMPETLELYLKTGGFEVDRRELLHPFPADQLFTDNADEVVLVEDEALAALAARIDRLHRRLDELVNGPRDFVVWARRPERDSS
jgi:O-antigen chain-terminating methyltransferase